MGERRCDKYQRYFTKEYMMGPNSLRLLDEVLAENAEAISGGRVLDLGCGEALTSVFVANETGAETVFALDLWIQASENYKRIKDNNLEDKIIPIHANAMDTPFADEYFDAIICIDAYHYFGCEDNVFAKKVLPSLKKGGYALISMPGVKKEWERFSAKEKELMDEWVGEDKYAFHTVSWWKEHVRQNCEDLTEVKGYEGKCFEAAWEDWFCSGNEHGIRDKQYFDKGLKELLNFVILVIKKK